MTKYLYTSLILSLFTMHVGAQSTVDIPTDTVYRLVTLDLMENGIILEKMEKKSIFILKEIAGIHPVVKVDESGKRTCIWNDNITVSSQPYVDANSPCKCTIYQSNEMIGLGFINDNGDIVKGTSIASWRPLPYIER